MSVTKYADRKRFFFVLLHMILYNVSIIIEDSNHDQLLDWLKGSLRENSYQAKFLKMIDSPHEGTTYCIQVVADTEEVINNFQQDILADLQAYIATSHQEKAFIFDSKMQYMSID